MNKLSNIFLSFLCIFSLSRIPPCEDSYVISIPYSIDLSECRSFEVSVSENNLSDYETLHIDMPSTFTLKDAHGKQDVIGTIEDPSFTFINTGEQSHIVNLDFATLSVGDWSGEIPIHIFLESAAPSNILEEGTALNEVLTQLQPSMIIFSNQTPEGNYIADVSLQKDESIKLYQNNDTVYIVNTLPDPIKASRDLSHAFQGLYNLTQIDLSHLDLSGCETISSLFENDTALTSIIGLENLDTSGIIDMSHLFSACTQLTKLNIAGWDTSSVQTLEGAFSYCEKLKTLSLNSWNVSACEDFSDLFSQCLSLTSVGDLSAWDMSRCTDLSGLFDSCVKLRNCGDLSSWNLSETRNLSRLFHHCEKLTSAGNIFLWDVSQVEDFSFCFAYAPLLDLTGLNDWDVSSHCTNLSCMFAGSDSALSEELNLNHWDVSQVTNMAHMFENTRSLKHLDISSWDTSSLSDASSMFAYYETLYLSQLEEVIGIEDFGQPNLQNISGIFYENQYFDGDLSAWDTSGLQDLSYAFYGCWRMDIDKLKHWNVSSVSDMTLAFGDGAGSLIQSPAPEWYH